MCFFSFFAQHPSKHWTGHCVSTFDGGLHVHLVVQLVQGDEQLRRGQGRLVHHVTWTHTHTMGQT